MPLSQLAKTEVAATLSNFIRLRSMVAVRAAAIRSAVGITRTATRIQTAMQFIRENFSRRLSVDQLANQVAMSPSHFAHSFREVSGVSPMRYVRDVRLDEARILMLGVGMVCQVIPATRVSRSPI